MALDCRVPFGIGALAAKGSLYVTRPTLATHISTPALLQEHLATHGLPAKRCDTRRVLAHVISHGATDLAPKSPVRGAVLRAVDQTTVRRRLEVPEDHLMVVTIGQLIDFKGIHVLVDAAGLLRHREKVTYLAIGEGERRQALEERIKREKMEAKDLLDLAQQAVIGAADLGSV